MKEFRILHLDKLEDTTSPLREVGIVEAKNFQDAFVKSQNLDDSWNPDTLCRSTSIGDYIEDVESEEIQQVMSIGFRIVEKPLVIYLDHE